MQRKPLNPALPLEMPDVSYRRVSEPPPSLEELRTGDPEVVQQAVRALMPDIRRWLIRLLGPRPDVDDATQDALIALVDALPRFEGRSSLRTFAHRITVRVAYRYFGKRQREERLQLVPPPPDEIDPESRAMSRESLRRLYACLERLPKKRRLAFVLCAIEGLSPRDAAKLAGTTPLAMRSRLMHARRDLTRRLQGDPYVQQLAARALKNEKRGES